MDSVPQPYDGSVVRTDAPDPLLNIPTFYWIHPQKEVENNEVMK